MEKEIYISMKFSFECDETDGLVLIDESYLNEINEEILYALDVFLDRHGKSELIQCLAYPDLEMEKILELRDVEKGTYAIENEGIRKIGCNKSITTKTTFNNIKEL